MGKMLKLGEGVLWLPGARLGDSRARALSAPGEVLRILALNSILLRGKGPAAPTTKDFTCMFLSGGIIEAIPA